MLDKEILLVLASETGRNCAVLPPEFAAIVARKLKRKFKIKVTPEEITSIIDGYVAIYQFATSALKESLRPARGEYASLGCLLRVPEIKTQPGRCTYRPLSTVHRPK